MNGKLTGSLLTAAVTVILAGPAMAQAGEQPPMTPEQKATMEAYQKAGTPGAPHKTLAASAGTYTTKTRSWEAPGGPAMEATGTATRTMTLDGRVLVEEFNSTMMGTPFVGHGMSGYDNVSGKYWST